MESMQEFVGKIAAYDRTNLERLPWRPTRSSRAMSESRSVAGIPRPAIRVLLLKWITLKREIDHFLSIATSADAAAGTSKARGHLK
jgi:hypothetical protein